MASFNRVVLVGNLTRDVELRYIPSGMAVSDIGLAINDRVKKDGQWVEETTFVDVTLWGRTAEIANEYLSKGSNVLIEGRLKLDSWETDGQERKRRLTDVSIAKFATRSFSSSSGRALLGKKGPGSVVDTEG